MWKWIGERGTCGGRSAGRLSQFHSKRPRSTWRSQANGSRKPWVIASMTGGQPFTVFTSSSKSRSEEHTSELQSLMRSSYAVFCLKKKKTTNTMTTQEKHN